MGGLFDDPESESLGDQPEDAMDIEAALSIPALVVFGDAPGRAGGYPRSAFHGKYLRRSVAIGMHMLYAIGGPSAWVRIRLAELPDFLAGFIGLDPKGDDRRP